MEDGCAPRQGSQGASRARAARADREEAREEPEEDLEEMSRFLLPCENGGALERAGV